MPTPPPALTLPGQSGDVALGDVAGRDVVQQGMAPEPVVELLGARIERQLDRLVTVTAQSVTALALLVCVHLLALVLWGATVFTLMQPYLVAGR
jgi:hypothetical protein